MEQKLKFLGVIGVDPTSISDAEQADTRLMDLLQDKGRLNHFLPAQMRDFVRARLQSPQASRFEFDFVTDKIIDKANDHKKRTDNNTDLETNPRPYSTVSLKLLPILGSLYEALYAVEHGSVAQNARLIASCGLAAKHAIEYAEVIDQRDYLLDNLDVALRHILWGVPFRVKKMNKSAQRNYFAQPAFKARAPTTFDDTSELVAYITNEKHLLESEIANGTIPDDHLSYLHLASLTTVNNFFGLNFPERNEALDGKRSRPVSILKTRQVERQLAESVELINAEIQVFILEFPGFKQRKEQRNVLYTDMSAPVSDLSESPLRTTNSASKKGSGVTSLGQSSSSSGCTKSGSSNVGHENDHVEYEDDDAEDDIESLSARAQVRIVSTRAFKSDADRRAVFASLRYQQQMIARANHHCHFDQTLLHGREVELIWGAVFSDDASAQGDSNAQTTTDGQSSAKGRRK